MKNIKNLGLVLAFLFFHIFVFSQKSEKLDLRYFMQSATAVFSKIPYGSNPEAGHYVQSGDAKIYYEIYGKGKPLVILHGGIVGSPYEMGQFIDSLSQHYKVIAISTRGHGKSEIGSAVPSYEQKAEDVNAVIQKESIDKVTILGFSDGAYTAYFFVKDYPEKIERLIAIGAGEWIKGMRKFDMNAQAILSMDNLYWEKQLELRPEPMKVDKWLFAVNTYYNSVEVGSSLWKTIKCPVLVLAGEKDENAPLNSVLKAYQEIPNAQLAIIPNAPHPVYLVNFPAVWTSLLPFLNKKK